MPADHINISHPQRYELHGDLYQDRLQNRRLQVELEMLKQFYELVSRNLESIFNRIESGQSAELHYPDGRVFIVTGKERE